VLHVAHLRESKSEVGPFDLNEALRLVYAGKGWKRSFVRGDAIAWNHGGIANGSPFGQAAIGCAPMASQNDDQSWPLGIVRLVVYAAIAMAVGYAIVHFWPAYYWPH
jgi:hypothetical protein